jgi:hypothetical protein
MENNTHTQVGFSPAGENNKDALNNIFNQVYNKSQEYVRKYNITSHYTSWRWTINADGEVYADISANSSPDSKDIVYNKTQEGDKILNLHILHLKGEKEGFEGWIEVQDNLDLIVSDAIDSYIADSNEEYEQERGQREFLLNLLGFLNWVDNSGKSVEEKYSLIQNTLPHDIRGVYVQDKWFSPRVSGYKKYTHSR